MTKFPNAIKAAKHLSKVDARVARLIQEVGKIKIELDPNESLFESLASSIIYQQLHGKAAATILARFKALHGFGEEGFPEPAAVFASSGESLRSAGLSQNKLKSIRDLAQKVIDGVVPDILTARTLPDEQLIEALTEVRGIGRWTAQMLLIFTLGRPDVWPIDDFGVRKGYSLVYGKREMPTPKQLEKHGEKFKPYRSAAAWYMWRATELPRFKK